MFECVGSFVEGPSGRNPKLQSVFFKILQDRTLENKFFTMDEAAFFPIAHFVHRHARKNILTEVNLLEDAGHLFDGHGRGAAEKCGNAGNPEGPLFDAFGEFFNSDRSLERFQGPVLDRKRQEVDEQAVAAVPVVIKSAQELELIHVLRGEQAREFSSGRTAKKRNGTVR